VGCGERRAWELLLGKPPTPQELAALSERLGYAEEELSLQDMTEGVDVLKENVGYLIGTLPHGKKKELADCIDVKQQTVTSWLRRGTPPDKSNREALKSYFGLSRELDLEREPIFLSPYPLAEKEQRRWLREQIDRLDADTLRALFPAFTRLFRPD
jgi:hypothetical protein